MGRKHMSEEETVFIFQKKICELFLTKKSH